MPSSAPGRAGPEPRGAEPGAARGLQTWKKGRETAVVWPMAKEAGAEQEGPEEGGMPGMTSGSWEKQDIVRGMAGDSCKAGTGEKERCWSENVSSNQGFYLLSGPLESCRKKRQKWR